ncbi:hypothetical protein C2W64_00826 [Brevibacillus laterosporus]|nr:hypothetical protein C2W64_00826 [Brevibacillus laterosporus]
MLCENNDNVKILSKIQHNSHKSGVKREPKPKMVDIPVPFTPCSGKKGITHPKSVLYE